MLLCNIKGKTANISKDINFKNITRSKRNQPQKYSFNFLNIYNFQEQTKLIYGDRNHKVVTSVGGQNGEIDHKMAYGNFLGVV